MRYSRKSVYKDPTVKTYEEFLYWTIKDAMKKQDWKHAETKSRMKLEVLYYHEKDYMDVKLTNLKISRVRRKKDLQNLLDCLCDALQMPRPLNRNRFQWKAGTIYDDSQISEIYVKELP